jgi:hypothetical protein
MDDEHLRHQGAWLRSCSHQRHVAKADRQPLQAQLRWRDLHLIEKQLAGMDYSSAPGFVIDGLKHAQGIAANAMTLEELFFAGLGEPSEPGNDFAVDVHR